MFFLVLLNCNKKILVPINRCNFSETEICQIYNFGSIGRLITKVFYSADASVDANFDLDISDVFIENVTAQKFWTVFVRFVLFFKPNHMNIHYHSIFQQVNRKLWQQIWLTEMLPVSRCTTQIMHSMSKK